MTLDLLLLSNGTRVYGYIRKCTEPGAAFGEVALLTDNGTRSASVIADEPTDLIVIDRALYLCCVQVDYADYHVSTFARVGGIARLGQVACRLPVFAHVLLCM